MNKRNLSIDWTEKEIKRNNEYIRAKFIQYLPKIERLVQKEQAARDRRDYLLELNQEMGGKIKDKGFYPEYKNLFGAQTCLEMTCAPFGGGRAFYNREGKVVFGICGWFGGKHFFAVMDLPTEKDFDDFVARVIYNSIDRCVDLRHKRNCRLHNVRIKKYNNIRREGKIWIYDEETILDNY
jgi:hypothetical protein